jgi:putative redox protein
MAQTVTGRVTWLQNLAFDGKSGSGHEVRLDSSREAGASPLELVLLGTGACSSVDVVALLKEMRQDVCACQCDLTAVRAETDPKVFTRIHFHFIVTGRDLESSIVERAINLGRRCPRRHDMRLACVRSSSVGSKAGRSAMNT